MSHTAVMDYEKGNREKIPADYVGAVCRAFGRSLSWVVWNELPERTTPPGKAEQLLEVVQRVVDPKRASYDLEEVLGLLRQIPPPESVE